MLNCRITFNSVHYQNWFQCIEEGIPWCTVDTPERILGEPFGDIARFIGSQFLILEPLAPQSTVLYNTIQYNTIFFYYDHRQTAAKVT